MYTDLLPVQIPVIVEQMGLTVDVPVTVHTGTDSHAGNGGIARLVYGAKTNVNSVARHDVSRRKILIDGGDADGAPQFFSVADGQANGKRPTQKGGSTFHIPLGHGFTDAGGGHRRILVRDGIYHGEGDVCFSQKSAEIRGGTCSPVSESEIEAAYYGGTVKRADQMLSHKLLRGQIPHGGKIHQNGEIQSRFGKLPQFFLRSGQSGRVGTGLC